MKDLDRFNHRTELSVRWGDMDAFQHVNNTVYLKWVEHARVSYMEQLMDGAIKIDQIGPILARQDIRYLNPVTYPDRIVIAYRISEVLSDRVICECNIYSKTKNRLVAICYNTIMAYDFKKLAKAEVPQAWLDSIKEIEKVRS